ncbi:TPA: B12-binding domain-containing radical SAM protein [Candidatus Micrarchaeota archaeon]|nr:B12-binding domain-containing radical SAM protein [Candidatus Micrarchaeota archaeon]
MNLAKIALIDPSQYTTNYGVRCVSSYLWEKGFEAKLIYLNPDLGHDKSGHYSQAVREDLAEIIKDCDVIGFTIFTNFYFNAVELTEFVRQCFPDKLIVWGGIHPSVSPETSIAHADIVCLGEGEETALEIMNMVSKNEFRTDILGTWVKTKDGVIKNETRTLEENLDRYPPQDYEPSHQYIIKGGRVVQVDEELLKEMLHLSPHSKKYFNLPTSDNYQYLTLSSRGCPYLCAFCANNAYRKLYTGKGRWLRSRSIKHVIDEIQGFEKKHDYVNFISFFDDEFLARPEQFITDFFDEYDKRVGLPFKCNVSVFNVSMVKMKRLHQSGLKNLEIGLQSGSERVHKEVYLRPFHPDKFLETAKILASFPDVTKYYDVILDDPYENDEDLSKTIVFLSKMPKPFKLSTFSLTFYPGTALYNRAVADGLVDSADLRSVIEKKDNKLYLENTYPKMLVLAASKTSPKLSFLYSIAAQPALIKAFSGPLPDKFFKKVIELAIKVRRT